jgi:hypothetical protein
MAAVATSLLPLCLVLSGCFTGVESTPKITYKDVKNQKVETTSPEATIAKEFLPSPINQWEEGKLLYVTSNRISLVLTADNPDSMPHEGDILVYHGSNTVTNLTGKNVVELHLTPLNSNTTLAYRTNVTTDELAERNFTEVPFTIDLDLVAQANSRLSGTELYIKSPLWLDPNGNAVNGRKFVKVKIDKVTAANEIYPFMVHFTDETGAQCAIYMSAATGTHWTPRDFAALFSLTDPHLSYPQIADDMWDNIIHTRVAQGMTKAEATLALGTPSNIESGHDHTSAYERWSYSDGIYLIFVDGLLERFNK